MHQIKSSRKQVYHYLFEFLMLFLAVTAGFFADNLREANVEHHRELKYMHTLAEDLKGDINEIIHYKVTGAHSPFHQVFWIKAGEQIIFFGGDDAPQLQQMKHRFVAKYDFDGRKAMELRRDWWDEGQKEKWTFLFYHDVKNPIMKF